LNEESLALRQGQQSLRIKVRAPYRLDLTVEALRRLSANVVDVVTPDGWYLRAFATPRGGTSVVEVRQVTPREIDVRISGRGARSAVPLVEQMLGINVDLGEWYNRAPSFPWLAALSDRLRGLKPPRYPQLWEAICHGIVFQQLSIIAAAAIMRRLVLECSSPIEHRGTVLYPFPTPRAILDTRPARFRAIGLSGMKASYLKNAAEAVASGEIRQERVESLPTPAAAAELSKLKGIGPWTAAVILLRGLGRLDTFPLNDSGAAQSIRIVSGNDGIDIRRVLSRLGEMRGMLYFHLLLGRGLRKW
jgi:DNA-3-methyladenine glycosylase II